MGRMKMTREKCKRCEGTGGTPYGEVGCCRTCHGSGWVDKEEPDLNAEYNTPKGGKDFVTKDSGQREEFSTGARRDSLKGKARYDLIPWESAKRLAELYQRGAVKYGENNWEKGIPFSRVYGSLIRHVFQYAEGDATEDHLAAVAWNAFTLMAYECRIQEGKLPQSLVDMGPMAIDLPCVASMTDAATCKPPDEGIKKLIEESQRWALLRPFVVDASAQFTYWPSTLFVATKAGLKPDDGGIY